MEIANVEAAYEALAQYLLSFIESRQWEMADCKFGVFGQMAKCEQRLRQAGKFDDQGGFSDRPSAVWDGLDAALFLRDDLLRTTGQRIWGLTFTLYPTGKFNIEYDYNKPDGYEETDETIDASEALNGLGFDKKSDESKPN